MKHTVSMLALAAAAALAPAAQAETQEQTQEQFGVIRAMAAGEVEVPPNESTGWSIASFELDGNILRADLIFRDLLAGTTMAHIHCCTSTGFSGTAPVALPFRGFPLGVRSSNYSRAFDLSDEATYDPAFLAAYGGTPASARAALVDAIGSDTAYMNIHTTEFPAGEIRGFLVAAPIPEPATWGMLGLGLAGLGMMGRRRARAGSVGPAGLAA